MEDYGPMVNIVAIALALTATFSTFLLKMLGNVNQWTWLIDGSPSFLVTAGARMIAVVIMALTYVTINDSNYVWFGVAALLIAALGFWAVARFDRLRKIHIVSIPLVGTKGQQLTNKNDELQYQNIVIGLESQLRPEARTALDKARKKRGGISLVQFMAGYGSNKLYDPEALWDRQLLAHISNNLVLALMFIILSAVTTLFLAAFIIEVAT